MEAAEGAAAEEVAAAAQAEEGHALAEAEAEAEAAAAEQEAAATDGSGWYAAFLFPSEPEPLYRATQEYASCAPSCTHTNFLKGVKWSPDGACLLTASDDSWLRLYDLPRDVQTATRLRDPDLAPSTSCSPPSSSTPSTTASPDNLVPALRFHAGETVYDYAWFSRMSALDPVSCCLASSSRGQPVHLWDAVSGELRCSYRGYNDVDEPTAAYSLAFSPDGGRLLAGYNKAVYVFDVARPGREYRRIVTHKRKQPESIAGIVSCLAFSPGSEVFAAGTYTGALGVYDARSLDLALLLSGHRGGLTQVAFSSDGNYLYSGARQDETLYCWDVRYSYAAVYGMARATAATNQRVAFDIEPCGRHLATGGCDGCVTVFDLQDGSQVDRQRVAADTVNGVGFHPSGLGLLATASGHRRYPDPAGPDDGATPDGGSGSGPQSAQPLRPANSLLVWRLQLQHLPLAAPAPHDAAPP